MSTTESTHLICKEMSYSTWIPQLHGKDRMVVKSDVISSFQSALNPRHAKIFHSSQLLHASSAQLLQIHVQSLFLMFALFLVFLHIELPSFHPNSWKGRSSFAFPQKTLLRTRHSDKYSKDAHLGRFLLL